MLKFRGKSKDFIHFMAEMKKNYGEITTIKEITEMIGALKNVNL